MGNAQRQCQSHQKALWYLAQNRRRRPRYLRYQQMHLHKRCCHHYRHHQHRRIHDRRLRKLQRHRHRRRHTFGPSRYE